MKEQLISFKTAKLAKEKGFNEIVSTAYGRSQESLYESNCTNRNSENIFLSAPTQSLLQKWLREVHNIHIEVHNLGMKWWFNLKEIDSDNAALFISDNYNSYEEALEVGLQEALKLI